MNDTYSKIATIVPLFHLEVTNEDAYFMALAHCAAEPAYVKFFQRMRKAGRYVILDNSAVEQGHPGSFEEYFDTACRMNVSSIMLPDYFLDAYNTYETARETMAKYYARIQVLQQDVIVIPQGKTIDQWIENMNDLANLLLNWNIIPTIGISCRYTEMFGGNRAQAVAAVTTRHDLKVHLLGAYANPRKEVAPLLELPYVQGVDSSYPSVYTQHGLKLTMESFSEPRPVRNIDFLLDRYDEELLRRNISTWKKACSPL